MIAQPFLGPAREPRTVADGLPGTFGTARDLPDQGHEVFHEFARLRPGLRRRHRAAKPHQTRSSVAKREAGNSATTGPMRTSPSPAAIRVCCQIHGGTPIDEQRKPGPIQPSMASLGGVQTRNPRRTVRPYHADSPSPRIRATEAHPAGGKPTIRAGPRLRENRSSNPESGTARPPWRNVDGPGNPPSGSRRRRRWKTRPDPSAGGGGGGRTAPGESCLEGIQRSA